MPRTDSNKVETILETDLSSNTITSWIDIATELIDDIENADSSIPDSRLEKLERLVAAHLASTQDQRIASGERESASVEFQGQTGIGLEGSKYGQQALLLDPTGLLGEDPSFTLSV